MDNVVTGYAHCPKCGERVSIMAYFHTVSCCNGKVSVVDLSDLRGPHECGVRK
jgi:hypothetical protein